MRARLEARLSQELWQILPSVLVGFCERLQERVFRDPGSEPLRRAPEPGEVADDPVGPMFLGSPVHPQVAMVGRSLAVVPVHGVLGRNWSLEEALFFGGYDLSLLDEQLQNIAEDEEVTTVVLDIRSPGGLAGEWEETVDLLREIRAGTGQAFVAYTSELCASAAMPLAYGCESFFVSPSSQVGSMGTITSGIDSSGAFERVGLQRIVVSSGSLKALGMPGKKWTEEEVDYLRGQVAEFHASYRAELTRDRDLPEEVFATAAVYRGKTAPAGVHDGITPRLERLVELLLGGDLTGRERRNDDQRSMG